MSTQDRIAQLRKELGLLEAKFAAPKKEPMTREGFYKTMYHMQQSGDPAHPADPVSQVLTKDAFESLVHRVSAMLDAGFFLQDIHGHYGLISHWGDTHVQADIYHGNELRTQHMPFGWLKWEGGTRLRQSKMEGSA